LWELAKERLTTEEIKNEMILRTDGERRNVSHIAVLRGKVEAMRKICDLSKKRLTKQEIRNEMLLHTDCEGRTLWHIAILRAK